MVAVSRLLPFAALLGAVGCSSGTEMRTVELNGAAYRFPEDHILSMAKGPRSFVRVSDPETGYELVYDSRVVGRRHPNGHPVIFSVTDGRFPDVAFIESEAGRIVCRRAADPIGGCGLRIDDGGVQWSMLFPEKRLAEAMRLKQQAQQELRQRRQS